MSSQTSNICGVEPETFGLSPTLLCWIKQGDKMVVGVIGQGTSRNLTAKWDAPLEQTNAGSQSGLEKLSGSIQALSGGSTSTTTFSTTQVWGGNNPLKFNLVLEFFAWDNAYKQVMQPLQWLEEFASPQVNGFSPFDPSAILKAGKSTVGRIPMRVMLNIGRRMIIPECVIESVSAPIDKEKDKDGNLIRATVTLDVQTLTMMNRDVIGETYAQATNTDASFNNFKNLKSESWKKD